MTPPQERRSIAVESPVTQSQRSTLRHGSRISWMAACVLAGIATSCTPSAPAGGSTGAGTAKSGTEKNSGAGEAGSAGENSTSGATPGNGKNGPSAPGDGDTTAATAGAGEDETPNAAVELVEWGLIGTELNKDGIVSGTLVSGRVVREGLGIRSPKSDDGFGMSGFGAGHGGKPVIYVYLPEGTEQAELSVGLGLSRIKAVESFPAPEQTDTTATWRVKARRTPCSAEERSPFPTRSSAACTEVADKYCEAAELANYVAPQAACLTVGETTSPLLFYRAAIQESAAAPVLPYAVTKGKNGELSIQNVSAHNGVGDIVRVVRSDVGKIAVAHVPAPKAGETVTIAKPEDQGIEESHVQSKLNEIVARFELPHDASTPFVAAWQMMLTSPIPKGGFEREPAVPAALTPAADAIWFGVPSAFIDELAPLTVEPANTKVHRGFLGYVMIEPLKKKYFSEPGL